MGTFVLVHGAGTGGFVWRRLAPLLRDAGHEVLTPTLTGVGERSHLAGPEVGLHTHITDVQAVLEWEDLYDVVLVGHSYGGMVTTGVAEAIPGRLRHLVYLDAFVPRDGESMLDQAPTPARAMLEQLIATVGGGTQVPPVPALVASFEPGAGADEAAQQALFARRLPMSVKTVRESVRTGNPATAALPHTYIYCTEKAPNDVFAPLVERMRQDPAWRYHELPTGHFAHATRPRALAELLLPLAALDAAPVRI